MNGERGYRTFQKDGVFRKEKGDMDTKERKVYVNARWNMQIGSL